MEPGLVVRQQNHLRSTESINYQFDIQRIKLWTLVAVAETELVTRKRITPFKLFRCANLPESGC